jgi:hypothetical protein
MTVANSRMTLGSVLAAVQTSANTISNTLNAANSAIGMVNTFVESAASNQKLRAKADSLNFKHRLIEEKAMETTEARIAIDTYCAQSPTHKQHYQSAYDELSSFMADA